MTQLPVGLVDALQELAEAGGIVDRPQARKAVAQHLDLELGQQSYDDDPFTGHLAALRPNLQRIKRSTLVAGADRFGGDSTILP